MTAEYAPDVRALETEAERLRSENWRLRLVNMGQAEKLRTLREHLVSFDEDEMAAEARDDLIGMLDDLVDLPDAPPEDVA